MTFTTEIGLFFQNFVPYHLWLLLEAIFAILLLAQCIYIRVYMTPYKDANNKHYYIKKLAQFAIYLQMMFSIICLVDVFYNFQMGAADPMMTIWLFAIFSAKPIAIAEYWDREKK